MQSILKTYLKRLTNLTSRNRSLLLLRLVQRQFFDLHELNFALNQTSFSFIEQLIEGKNLISLCEYLDPRNERTNELSKHLGMLARTEQLIREERGAEDLYVGYPFVQGKLKDDTLVRCPLLFFPVSLTLETVQKSSKWCLKKRNSEVIFNRSFLLAYSHFNEVKLSDDFLETNFEDFPNNALAFRTALYEFLKTSVLEINFNQDIFHDSLIHFLDFTKSSLNETERTGELKLFPQAILGIFPQAGSYLAADYEAWLSEPNLADFSEFWNKNKKPSPERRGLGEVISEENLLTPLTLDASQEAAIKRIKSGHSLVVQGPPGTGKSQLIANLIADFTAHGKRVLLVCQKRAALDTVYSRLCSVGIEPFLALVHDFKGDRKELFDKIAHQIEQIEAYKKQNLGLDSIFLEREFDQTCRQIDQLSKTLEELRFALFDESIAGKSVKELYLSLAQLRKTTGEIAILPIENLFRQFRLNELEPFLEKVRLYEKYHHQLSNGSMAADFWANRRSAANWLISDKKKIEALFYSMGAWQQTLSIDSEQILAVKLHPLDLEQFSVDTLSTILSILRAAHTDISSLSKGEVGLPQAQTDNRQTQTEIRQAQTDNIFWQLYWQQPKGKFRKVKDNWFSKNIRLLDDLEKSGGILPTPLPYSLAHLKTIVADALDSADNWFTKTAWKLSSTYKNDFKIISTNYALPFERNALQQFLQKIENTEHFFVIKETVESWDVEIENQLSDLKLCLESALISKKAADLVPPLLHQSLLIKAASVAEISEQIKQLIEWTTQQQQYFLEWNIYLTNEQIEQAFDLDKTELIRYLSTHFDYIVEADQLKNTFSKAEWECLYILQKRYQAEHVDALTKDFDKPSLTVHWEAIIKTSLWHFWIEAIEEYYPILRGVSTFKVNDLENSLQKAIQKKQSLCEAIVQLRLRENTYQNLEKNRLGNTTTYRELYHQVTKRRKIWPIRRIIETFGDELFQLLPCWMASPETVSAIYPTPQLFDKASKQFDLVIFDEASQCFAEHGLPAAARGTQVVIAGDDKQLQPNELYQIRFEDETDESMATDIDSLLNLAEQFLPQTQLTGHYRSKSLELIAFSNRYFYKNTLSLLPHFQYINSRKKAIHFLKTAGIWENNQNQEEAEKVVDILRKSESNKTYGIVTFNYKQAELIEKKLLINKLLSENIKVKNIENIQGDEFDIVIFSIGYAPNKTGKLVVNFGSLNQRGGENRLNVAITRAKEEVMVICSIEPELLQVETTQNDGPKLLKNYLLFAKMVSEQHFQPLPYTPQQLLSAKTLKDVLKAENKALSNELPFADLVEKQNDSYTSLLLTDDDIYFESPSAKHTHGYFPLLLQEKGWPFVRRWSREVFS